MKTNSVDVFELDELELMFKIDLLESEIQYARTQIEPHDTGHIYTAISWMQQRKKQLQSEYESVTGSK